MKIGFLNGEQIVASSSEYDTKVYGLIWKDAPVDYDSSKRYKLEDDVVIEMELSEYEPEKLRIYRSLDPNLSALSSDFSILGFRKISPSYERGRKTKAEYLCATADDLIVEKIFMDVRDSNGILTDLQITFNWYSEDNTIGLSKTEIARSYNKSEARTEERKRRARQIDYLEAEAEGTTAEPYVNLIIATYQAHIDKYVQYGITTDWEDAMDNETDTTLVYVLNSVYQPRRDDPTKTINTMQSIKYQMGLMTLAEIETANGE